MRVLVAGAGGFIGGHLTKRLLQNGMDVVAVDKKPFSDWYQLFSEAQNLCLDLTESSNCREAVKDCSWVFNLAADMGGMGFIENNKALCMISVLINTLWIETFHLKKWMRTLLTLKMGMVGKSYLVSGCVVIFMKILVLKFELLVSIMSMARLEPIMVEEKKHQLRQFVKYWSIKVGKLIK